MTIKALNKADSLPQNTFKQHDSIFLPELLPDWFDEFWSKKSNSNFQFADYSLKEALNEISTEDDPNINWKPDTNSNWFHPVESCQNVSSLSNLVPEKCLKEARTSSKLHLKNARYQCFSGSTPDEKEKQTKSTLTTYIFQYAFDPRDFPAFMKVNKSGYQFATLAIKRILTALQSYPPPYTSCIWPRECFIQTKFSQNELFLKGNWTAWLHATSQSEQCKAVTTDVAMILASRKSTMLSGGIKCVLVNGVQVDYFEGTFLVPPSQSQSKTTKKNLSVQPSKRICNDIVISEKWSFVRDFAKEYLDLSYRLTADRRKIRRSAHNKNSADISSRLFASAHSKNTKAQSRNTTSTFKNISSISSNRKRSTMDATKTENVLLDESFYRHLSDTCKKTKSDCPQWLGSTNIGYVYDINYSFNHELSELVQKKCHQNDINWTIGGGNIVIYETLSSWLDALAHDRVFGFLYHALDQGIQEALKFLNCYDNDGFPYDWEGYFSLPRNITRWVKSKGLFGSLVPMLKLPSRHTFSTYRTPIFDQLIDESVSCHNRAMKVTDKQENSDHGLSFQPSIEPRTLQNLACTPVRAASCVVSNELRTPSPWSFRRVQVAAALCMTPVPRRNPIQLDEFKRCRSPEENSDVLRSNDSQQSRRWGEYSPCDVSSQIRQHCNYTSPLSCLSRDSSNSRISILSGRISSCLLEHEINVDTQLRNSWLAMMTPGSEGSDNYEAQNISPSIYGSAHSLEFGGGSQNSNLRQGATTSFSRNGSDYFAFPPETTCSPFSGCPYAFDTSPSPDRS